MLKEKFKKFAKIENIVFLIIILVVTTIAINYILKEDKSTTKNENTTNSKVLADSQEETNTSDLQSNLEKISTENDKYIISYLGHLDDIRTPNNFLQALKILSTIKGVGKVKVFISYSESSKTIAMYDEKTTTSSTEETDSSRWT